MFIGTHTTRMCTNKHIRVVYANPQLVLWRS